MAFCGGKGGGGFPGMGGGGFPGMGGGSGGGGMGDPGGMFGDLFGNPGKPHIFPSPVLYFDPLGRDKFGNYGGAGGGPENRTKLFKRISRFQPDINRATRASITGLNEAATDPGWDSAAQLARSEINGDYLHGSPELDASMAGVRAAGNREFGDAAANLRDQYSRTGMGFSTAEQQAEQGARSAATAKAGETEANARLQNYINERGIQQEAPNTLNTALGKPIDYLSQISGAVTNPAAQVGQLIKGLFGNGQITVQPQDIVEDPGKLGQIFGTVGRL